MNNNSTYTPPPPPLADPTRPPSPQRFTWPAHLPTWLLCLALALYCALTVVQIAHREMRAKGPNPFVPNAREYREVGRGVWVRKK